MAGIEHPRPGWARIALAALTAALLALALVAGRGALAPEPAHAQVCSNPSGLSPQGSGPTRFTMLLRVNTQGNVDDYTSSNPADGGLAGHIRSQDIFVLNTRFLGNQSGTEPPMTPTVAADLAQQLKARFPCNRIIALNGLSFDPTAAGFAFSLYNHPAVWALVSDFEAMDWNQGKATDPGRPNWTQKYRKSLKRIKRWVGGLSRTLAGNSVGARKRAGLAPIDASNWDYGEIAQAIDKKNRRLGGRHLGPMSVMTQDACANGSSTFGSRAKTLLRQFKFRVKVKRVKRGGKKRKVKTVRKIKKKARPKAANLALQISFSNTPSSNGSMALTRTSAATADACVRRGLKKGGGAFFFFASTKSLALLFQQPRVGGLRPAV